MAEKKVKLTIDGIEVEAPADYNVIQAAELVGIEIPHFCYHPALSVSGNCRMCLVELEINGKKLPKLQTSCTTKVQEGMVVYTNTENVQNARKAVLEFTLINHPVDCPICDQAGECKLQDYYFKYSLQPSRFELEKVHKPKRVDIGPRLILDAERCILCTRCVRFLKEYTGTEELGIFNRGDRSEVGLYDGKVVDNPYSMNLADLCPVGAITTKDFRFKSRVWFLKSTPSICPGCERGCNIYIDTKDNYIMRIRPRHNDDVNGYFMCDDGRLLYHRYYERSRLSDPMKRVDGELKVVSWSDAGWQIREDLRDIKKAGGKIVAIASAHGSNEDLYLFSKLMKDYVGAEVYYKRDYDASGYMVEEDDKLIKADKNPNKKGAENLGMKEFPGGEAIKDASAVIIWGEGFERYVSSLDVLKDKKVVFVGQFVNDIVNYADFVLPALIFAERDGTFTNFEGKVQEFSKAIEGPANALPEWEIFSLLLHAYGYEKYYDDIKQVQAEIKGYETV